MPGEPGPRLFGPDVDGVSPGRATRGIGRRHPSGGGLLRAVLETASRKSCAWRRGERQPLLMRMLTPSFCSVPRRQDQGLAQGGIEVGDGGSDSSKIGTPLGTTPSASSRDGEKNQRLPVGERVIGAARDTGERRAVCNTPKPMGVRPATARMARTLSGSDGSVDWRAIVAGHAATQGRTASCGRWGFSIC